MNEEKLQDSLEGIGSELAYLGEKLTEISKCLKKMSNWSEEDEDKFGDSDEDE
jgi:prefoldin subunit 5